MEYRGHTIVVDKDESGAECVYVYLPNADETGSDPIEVIGGIAEAKSLINTMIRDLAEFYDNDEWGDAFRHHDSSRERLGSDY